MENTFVDFDETLSEIESQGYYAAKDGKDSLDNPYDKGSKFAGVWRKGFYSYLLENSEEI